jgi:hypothetical protein
MFMGSGIRGNRVIGTTDNKQLPTPVNPKSLANDKGKGIRVRPEHIHKALREFAQIDKHKYSSQFPLKVSDEGRLQGLFG